MEVCGVNVIFRTRLPCLRLTRALTLTAILAARRCWWLLSNLILLVVDRVEAFCFQRGPGLARWAWHDWQRVLAMHLGVVLSRWVASARGRGIISRYWKWVKFRDLRRLWADHHEWFLIAHHSIIRNFIWRNPIYPQRSMFIIWTALVLILNVDKDIYSRRFLF